MMSQKDLNLRKNLDPVTQERAGGLDESFSSGTDDENKHLYNTFDDRDTNIFLRAVLCLCSHRKQKMWLKARACVTRWRFHCLQTKAALETKGYGMDINKPHRKKYFAAFVENERLLSKLSEDTQARNLKFSKVKHSGGARMLLTFWICLVRRIQALFFQRWKLNIDHVENMRKLLEMNEALSRGRDMLDERRCKMRNIDELNSRLQLSLLVVLSVLRLRAHSFLASLSSARKEDAKQRTLLYQEVTAIKGALGRFRSEDERAVETALERGQEYIRALNSVKTNVLQSLKTQKALKKNSDEMNQKQQDLYSEQEQLAQMVLSPGAYRIEVDEGNDDSHSEEDKANAW